jgi:hypothetical protein
LNNLRKIGLWLWYAKEKIILGVVILALGYSIYSALNPEPVPPVRASNPSSTLTDPPPAPPARPPRLPETDPQVLVQNNPFTVQGGGPAVATQREQAEETGPDITLRGIRESGGREVAELATSGRRQLKAEGDTVDGYRVQRIDADDNTVTLRSEEDGSTFTLNAE